MIFTFVTQYILRSVLFLLRHAVPQLVGALRYNPKGRGFDFKWCRNFLHNPSGRTMALGSTQLITEMSTWKIFWG
jgi:hypothetical protein